MPAGDFVSWLADMSESLDGGGDAAVPCDGCNACCKGSYFIHVSPTESRSLEAIPEALLFPAPGRPAGHKVLGFDESGRCPMLAEEACSIYVARPKTCRTYDCRIFAATGIGEPGPEKAAIMARARRWRFTYADRTSEARHAALIHATRFLARHHEALGDALPTSVTQLSMLAVRSHSVLIDRYRHGGLTTAGLPSLANLLGSDTVS